MGGQIELVILSQRVEQEQILLSFTLEGLTLDKTKPKCKQNTMSKHRSFKLITFFYGFSDKAGPYPTV